MKFSPSSGIQAALKRQLASFGTLTVRRADTASEIGGSSCRKHSRIHQMSCQLRCFFDGRAWTEKSVENKKVPVGNDRIDVIQQDITFSTVIAGEIVDGLY